MKEYDLKITKENIEESIRNDILKRNSKLNKLIETPGLSGVQVSEKLVEVLGHTPFQVFVGAIIGIIVGCIF